MIGRTEVRLWWNPPVNQGGVSVGWRLFLGTVAAALQRERSGSCYPSIRPWGGMMRELYDADIWRLKKVFRSAMVAASVAALVTLALAATDF